jgi:transcriptional regulator with XRE-family HTH domain
MSTEFPKRLSEKLKTIRECHSLPLLEILERFDARNIDAFESGAADLPLSVLYAYAKVGDVPVENLLDDDLDVWFGHRVN